MFLRGMGELLFVTRMEVPSLKGGLDIIAASAYETCYQHVYVLIEIEGHEERVHAPRTSESISVSGM